MTHDQLCERAKRWLSGTRRCNPVFSNCASCAEIPDAIGWSSSHQWRGSTVIEVKTSIADFYADKKKYQVWKEPVHGWTFPAWRVPLKEAKARGYTAIDLPSMGDYRFYFCLPEVLSVKLIEKRAPDHGLIWLYGRAVRIMRPAPKRELVDKDSEIRFLRFAIINRKETFVAEAVEECQLELPVRVQPGREEQP